jgi:hypothetical protein
MVLRIFDILIGVKTNRTSGNIQSSAKHGIGQVKATAEVIVGIVKCESSKVCQALRIIKLHTVTVPALALEM